MEQSKIFSLSDIGAQQLQESKELYYLLLQTTDVNASYQVCYQILKLGSLAAEIPRLVVFGQQSMGKTTLLDYIMGGPIGFSSTDTGTKQPVVIMLKPSPSQSSKIDCKLQGKSLEIHCLPEEMKKLMNKTHIISQEEIELQMTMPNCVHAVFVDLPGIKDDSKEGAQLTRSVVKNYVQNNPNDVYVLVKKASDDPANWPWSLREFILSKPPKGLGLSSRQTIVVGTRAKEFLLNERTDISTHDDLLDRVNKRAVRDSSGQALPLYLLELFSFSLQQKETTTFQERRENMFEQIAQNSQICKDIILTQFEKKNNFVQNSLLQFFDVNAFKFDLNQKLQILLHEQLSKLQIVLKQRAESIQEELQDLETQLYEQNPQTIREQIYLFIRELTGIITELVTGNYMIIKFPDSGEQFLQEFGGNLSDNLREGHKMAVELFSRNQLYSEDFLDIINMQADLVLRRKDEYLQSSKTAKFQSNLSDIHSVYEFPAPNLNGSLQPGQFVHFAISKDKSRILGFIQSMTCLNEPEKTDMITVCFFYVPPENETGEEHTQSRPVKTSRVHVIYPLTTVLTEDPQNIPPLNFRCWARKLRSDTWMGIIPVCIRKITLITNSSDEGPAQGTVSYVPLIPNDSSNLLSGDQADEYSTSICSIEDIFIDAESFDNNSPRKYKVDSWKTLTQLQKIAGDFAETPLLNQLSLTYLGRWLKFHILSLEPNRRFSDHVMLQLMRSVKNVIDKADWEPLVADLLQANVRGNLLQLTKLASCATAAALKRILLAAISEVKRLIMRGELNPKLKMLATNSLFIQKVEAVLNDFCKKRALSCSETMQELIFEQTHAIHFEMIQDFFEGCRQFEREFLDGRNMEEVTKRVREGLENRKHKLRITDIYSRETSGVSHEMIYEEVRIQFWVIKMLLSAPLTTKLYMYFIKDIKDKSKHVAVDVNTQDVDLERELQKNLLFTHNDLDATRLDSGIDGSILTSLNLERNREILSQKIEGLKRANEYVKIALDSVSKLYTAMKTHGQVDFLTRLSASNLEIFQDSVEN